MRSLLIVFALMFISCKDLFMTDAFTLLSPIIKSSSRHQTIVMSTITKPNKVDKTTKKKDSVEPSIPDFLFKENRDVQKEFEDYCDENKFYVILYNDPFNKRLYVQNALMEVEVTLI